MTLQYFIEMNCLNNLFLKQNFCFSLLCFDGYKPFLSQIWYSKQFNPFINSTDLSWASIFVLCFNSVAVHYYWGVRNYLTQQTCLILLIFMFVINHVGIPNESNLNYFTLSFLDKRLEGGKWSAWAFMYVHLLYFI